MEWGTASVDFNLGGQRVHADITIPAGPVRARVMLPVFQKMADFVIAHGEVAAQQMGEAVSCRKGCAACCRQMVAVGELEAHYLRDLVARLPEPRRTEICARFAAAHQRFAQAGLQERLLHFNECTRSELDQLSREYFALQVPCTFLEDEECSIYADRPLLCRQYLVVSPPERCSEPGQEGVRGLLLPTNLAHIIARLGQTPPPEPTRWILLPEALAWAEAHPDEPPPRPGPEVLREVLHQVASSSASRSTCPLSTDGHGNER
jgi:Fe-S-cluster containining protein